MYLSIKRLLDILFSGMGILILSPIFLVVSILIKADSTGPIFFHQERLGKNGFIFDMIKFRSMVTHAEKMGTGLFNYENDPRVTKVGRVLRNTSLDELPQLINVLKGDMSIIGPRPAVTYELGDFKTLNKRYKKRFEVLPGITGLAQINGRNDILWDDKVEYDNKYVDLLKQKGFSIDAKIFVKTLAVVFSKSDICENKPAAEIEDELLAKLAAEDVIKKAHEPD